MSIASFPERLRRTAQAGTILIVALLAAPTHAAEVSAEALQKKCDAKDWAACVELGDDFTYGEGDQAIRAKGAALYRRACDAKFASGCTALGTSYDMGYGVPSDPGKALALYRQACDGNDGQGCESLANAHLHGKGLPKDLSRAVDLYQKACDLKAGDACWRLAQMYLEGEGVAKDEAKYKALNQRGCELGSVACQMVAYSVAIEPYDPGCKRGDAEACYWIGGAYDHGWDQIEIDLDLAAMYYTKSCDGGYAQACTGLGILHALGKGVALDMPKAAVLYAKACEGNDANGCALLGDAHENGLGARKDPARAATLYAKACRLGSKDSCGYTVAGADSPRPKPTIAATKPAVATAATPAKAPSVTPGAATPAGTACELVKVRLGVDTVASVERDIKARGGSTSSGTGLGKHRLSAMSGDYRDGGTDVMAVNYDFDANAPTGRLIAVTIVNHANSGSGYEKMLAARKAAAATITGPLQQKTATEFVASAPNCKLRFLPNADTWFIHEVYELPK